MSRMRLRMKEKQQVRQQVPGPTACLDMAAGQSVRAANNSEYIRAERHVCLHDIAQALRYTQQDQPLTS